MELEFLELKLAWPSDIPLVDLRSFVREKLILIGDPLRWAITDVSLQDSQKLSIQIIVEAVVIKNE